MNLDWQVPPPQAVGWTDLVVSLPTSLLLLAFCLSAFGVGGRIAGFLFHKGAPVFVAVVIGLVGAGLVFPLLGVGFGIVANGATPLIRLLLTAGVAAGAWAIVFADRVVLAAVQLRRHRRTIAADATV